MRCMECNEHLEGETIYGCRCGEYYVGSVGAKVIDRATKVVRDASYERGWRDAIEAAASGVLRWRRDVVAQLLARWIRAIKPTCNVDAITDCVACGGRGQIDTGPATWNCPQCKGTGEWRCECGDKHRCSCGRKP